MFNMSAKTSSKELRNESAITNSMKESAQYILQLLETNCGHKKFISSQMRDEVLLQNALSRHVEEFSTD